MPSAQSNILWLPLTRCLEVSIHDPVFLLPELSDFLRKYAAIAWLVLDRDLLGAIDH
jgi:hypothetical protein